RELIVERTRAGLAAARDKGRTGGRPPKLSNDKWVQIKKLLSEGHSRAELAKTYNISKNTIYRHCPVYKKVD
ncbi:DNA-invertase, partial [Salmonella enterica]|nr:DNA-invertase [Salmonella enterica]EAO7619221.1 DNA-invertase [Salmonella enterica]